MRELCRRVRKAFAMWRELRGIEAPGDRTAIRRRVAQKYKRNGRKIVAQRDQRS